MVSREVRRLDVVFKDQQATYRPGDVVAGVVYLELSGELKMKGRVGRWFPCKTIFWQTERWYGNDIH